MGGKASCLGGANGADDVTDFYANARVEESNQCVVNNTVVVTKTTSGEPKTINNYRVKRALGEGAHGQVYLCRTGPPRSRLLCFGPSGRQEYAVKVLSRKDAKESKVEYKVLKSVQHEHIVQLLEFIDDKNHDCIYIVFERLYRPIGRCTETGELDLAHGQKWTEQVAVPLCIQMVEALVHLHSLGVLHRDIKPENVVYATPEMTRVKLIDFGESRVLREKGFGDDSSRITKGTPFFHSSEMLSGRHFGGRACDVWALGVLFYLLLVGHVPYGRGSANLKELFDAIEFEALQFPADVGASLASDLLTGMLNRTVPRRLTLPAVLAHVWFADPLQQQQQQFQRSVPEVEPAVHDGLMSVKLADEQMESQGDQSPKLSSVVPVDDESRSVASSRVGASSDFLAHSARSVNSFLALGSASPPLTTPTSHTAPGFGQVPPRGRSPANTPTVTPIGSGSLRVRAVSDVSFRGKSSDLPERNPLRSPGFNVLKHQSYSTEVTRIRAQSCDADSQGSVGYMPKTPLQSTDGIASTLSALLGQSTNKTEAKKVLVVEDSHQDRYLLSRTMNRIAICPETSPLVIHELYDGASAVNIVLGAAREGCPYNLVIVDVYLPGMSGVAAVAEIRNAEMAESLDRTLVVLASTLEERPANLQEIEESLSVATVPKPFTPQQVAKMLHWMGVRTKNLKDFGAEDFARPTHVADSQYYESMNASAVLEHPPGEDFLHIESENNATSAHDDDTTDDDAVSSTEEFGIFEKVTAEESAPVVPNAITVTHPSPRPLGHEDGCGSAMSPLPLTPHVAAEDASSCT
eukprot:TRINITY_DN4938_c0_g1_i3.p1 TRINITY_DN4938_c0_g1~~TRINITY_DN4938_c0_g1_i3.p1  ORF type:complete len:805 (+),score=133.23 TRINITY_DN4938_c0_g1_i3:127-2541(+)